MATSLTCAIIFSGAAFSTSDSPVPLPEVKEGGPISSPTVSPQEITQPLGEDWWVIEKDDWKGKKLGENIVPEEAICDSAELPEVSFPDCVVIPEIEESVGEVAEITATFSTTLASKSLYPQERVYKTRVKKSGSFTEWSKPLKLKATMKKVRSRLRAWGGPARFAKLQRNISWSNWLSIKKASAIYRDRLASRESGTVWYIESRQNKNINATVIKSKDIIYDTEGTLAIDRIITALRYNFDNWSVWGIFACRSIAGTYTWSQHAYANAVDFGASSSKMREMAYWLARHPRLPVSQIIYSRMSWTPSGGWRYYGGINPHYDHVHVSGSPYITGTPSCAR